MTDGPNATCEAHLVAPLLLDAVPAASSMYSEPSNESMEVGSGDPPLCPFPVGPLSGKTSSLSSSTHSRLHPALE